MKKIVYLACCLLLFTCEEVIELDLKTMAPKLVIDASLSWFKETSGNNQLIKLTLTAPYYSANIPPATGATVTVTDSYNNTYNFTEESDLGIYRNQSFLPEINGIYKLKIIYNNEVYTASETLIPVVSIDKVEQKNNGGFTKDETEIKAFYLDPENIKNFYFFEFINRATNTISLEVYDDKFTDGNQTFAIYSNKDLKKNDEVIVQNHGVSKRYFQYMTILLQQSDEEFRDPFEVQPATIRGNCVNETNPENYPLGYFRACEVSVYKYIIE